MVYIVAKRRSVRQLILLHAVSLRVCLYVCMYIAMSVTDVGVVSWLDGICTCADVQFRQGCDLLVKVSIRCCMYTSMESVDKLAESSSCQMSSAD